MATSYSVISSKVCVFGSFFSLHMCTVFYLWDKFGGLDVNRRFSAYALMPRVLCSDCRVVRVDGVDRLVTGLSSWTHCQTDLSPLRESSRCRARQCGATESTRRGKERGDCLYSFSAAISVHPSRRLGAAERSCAARISAWGDEDYGAPGAEAVDLRSRELLVRRRVGPGGGGARERDGRQPLRLLPARRRPRVHRLRCPHRRSAHPARPATVRSARR